MPELPEIETIRYNLTHEHANSVSLVGKDIHKGNILWARSLIKPSVSDFESRISGQVINEIGRRGKYLLFILSTEILIIHLGMSGDLLVEPSVAPIAHHYRLLLEFSDGYRLSFNDPRKFGRIWLVRNQFEVLASLGPEPLDPEFTADDLHEIIANHHRQLKPLLMDQKLLAGLGNIYTDEALHRACLHPLKLSHQLTRKESKRLWESIRFVLEDGILHNGASIDWVYRGGDFQNTFRVYQRTGKPCPECHTTVEKIVVGQRGTHYCPVCQPL